MTGLVLLSLVVSGSFHSVAHAEDRRVDLELVLAIDVSRSINDEEYALQMTGYANAFRDARVVQAIKGQSRGIAVAMVQWGDGKRQHLSVPWTYLSTQAEAAAFAKAVEDAPRQKLGHGTGLSQALAFSSRQFGNNGFTGVRQVIDISGDGRDNVGPFPMLVREGLVGSGLTINGLAILNEDPTLKLYFESVVAGGENAFVESAEDYVDFSAAIIRKLVREISNNVISLTPDRVKPPVIVIAGETGQEPYRRAREPLVE